MPAHFIPTLPICVDSSGFASLFAGSQVGWSSDDGCGFIEFPGENGVERTCAQDILTLQQNIGDIGFTLGAIVTPDMPASEAVRRIDFTVRNAAWAICHRRDPRLRLFASLQCTDSSNAREIARDYARMGFGGVAVGGMVPRLKNISSVVEIVSSVRSEIGDLPLHVFGVGKPDLVRRLFEAGADSVDSSSYVKSAVEGVSWASPGKVLEQPSFLERLHLALENLSVLCRDEMILPVM